MSRFEDLGDAYGRWHKDHIDYQRRSAFFIRQFAEGLRVYIDAPKTYTPFGGGDAVPYVVVMETQYDRNGDLRYRDTPRTQAIPDLVKDDDGYWLAGIKLTVEMGPNTEPRHAFSFPIRFALRDQTCLLALGDEPAVTIDLQDPQGSHKVYDTMLSWLNKLFATPAWETASEARRIGFIE